jgi:transcriptional regulator with XRE-family HTH domain
MLTALGKALRKLRIERDLLLRDMADALGVSSAFLSAVETGRKKAPSDFIEKICKAYNLLKEERQILHEAAENSLTEVSMKMRTEKDRELVLAFAKKFPNLNENERRALLDVLTKGL